jgi:hypothetical protein
MMAKQGSATAVYLEVGQKKTFAGALDWPGWCRSGRDEAAALAALADYGPRYANLFAQTTINFTTPGGPDSFTVAERFAGTSTTEFGAPGIPPKHDAEPFDEAECARSEAILAAIWRAFDRAIDAAEGRELRKGPRGGGRERDKIVRHVLGSDAGYLGGLGQKFKADDDAPIADELQRTREAIRAALKAAARGELPEQRPRGGTIWQPRYYVRRVAWHTLDHVWEIEDRVQ